MKWIEESQPAAGKPGLGEAIMSSYLIKCNI